MARSFGHSVLGALAVLVIAEVCVVFLCVGVKKLLVGSKWGADHSTPFWSLRHFAYFFAQDCFFVWCREPLRFFAGTVVANSILRWMGCRIGDRTIIPEPMQCFDWNAVNVGNDCVVQGFLQFHTFENMTLTVKRASVGDGCAVNTGATIMSGSVLEPGSTLVPLSMVLKEMTLPSGVYEGSPAEPAIDPETVAFKRPETAGGTSDSPAVSRIVDNTDWLKTAAIILVLIDHIGYFFIDDGDWWSVFGRLAAPVFFFLIGYAHTSKVPLQWLMLGVILTVLESANNDWAWVAPNILLSFALVRLGLPHLRKLVEKQGWVAFAVIAAVLVALLPIAGKVVDYGSEGWLWALLGFAQRMYADRSAVNDSVAAGKPSRATAIIGVLVCAVAAGAYVWQEQKEFDFSEIQLTTFIVCVGVLSLSLCLFARGPSRIQPPAAFAGALSFIGRHTLAIYAIELAAFEILILLVPALSP